MNDEIAAERDALAGASDQAEYGAPAEYGAASAPVGDYEAAVEEARRGRRVGGRRGGENISLFSENISFHCFLKIFRYFLKIFHCFILNIFNDFLFQAAKEVAEEDPEGGEL